MFFSIGRQKQKTTRFGSDPMVKRFWRFIRVWVTHNHNIYYSYVLGSAIMLYQFWYWQIIGNYQKRNVEVSPSISSCLTCFSINRDPWSGLRRRRDTGRPTSPLTMMMMTKRRRKKSELLENSSGHDQTTSSS